jgi:hypothetical protein
MTITVRTLAILVALVVSGSIAGVMLLVRHHPVKPASVTTPAHGVPTVLSAEELRSLPDSTRPIYWAGELPRRRLELTTTERGAFIRYLPVAARVGGRGRALTVATYELPSAWDVAQRAARQADARQRRLPDGRIAVWRTTRPTSVYLARPGSAVLVEVFDPDARKARHLSLSGLIQPVRGA